MYATVCVAAFVVPSPLGGNVGRMPLLLAVPLVLLADPRRLRPVLLLVPVVVGCQAIEVAQVASASITDQSTTPDYYDGVLRYLRGVPGPVRVEIPATSQHWESVYVGATVEMARGWERQLDRRLNPEFYDRDHPLDAARYHQWLLRDGVSYVALPDTSFDASSRREAHLVREGLSDLHPVYRDPHWVVYKVVGAPTLLEGPGRLDLGRRAAHRVRRTPGGPVHVARAVVRGVARRRRQRVHPNERRRLVDGRSRGPGPDRLDAARPAALVLRR